MSNRQAVRAATASDERTAARLRRRLVTELRRTGRLRSDAVAGAFGAVPRELFVEDIAAGQGLEAVYRDEPLPAKTDDQGWWLSSSSQPSIMAVMLEQLEVAPGQRVLEIGAGTGYNAALLRHLVGPDGRVTTIDVDPELARRARRALRRGGFSAKVVAGDGRHGFAEGAPYDRIIVTASADEIPNAWLDQLRPGGRLQLPLRLDSEAVPQVIPVLERRDDHAESIAMTWGAFMALHEGGGGPSGPSTALHACQWATGQRSGLVRITGPALERFSDTECRRLLALVLNGPASSRPEGRVVTHWPSPPAPLLHLLLRVPAARRIELHTTDREAVGLVSEGGRNVAVASAGIRGPARGGHDDASPSPRREPWSTETYGDPELVGELEDLLDEWRRLSRSGRTRLQIAAHRSSTRPSAELHFDWKRPTRG